MSKPPIISVIIPAYDAERFIAETLDSVIAQTFTDWEAIVVDDGSTDNTKNIVQEFCQKDTRIKYIYQRNSSQAVARNTGINNSSGEFIAFLDADDLWHPQKLSKQLTLFNHLPTGVVYSGVENIDTRGKKLFIPCTQKFLRGNVFPQICFDNFLPCSSVVVRASLIKSNNLYFRTGRKGVEDWDMWIRMATITEFDYIPEPLLCYRIHDNNMSKNYLPFTKSQIITLTSGLKLLKDSDIPNKSYYVSILSEKIIPYYLFRYVYLLFRNSSFKRAIKALRAISKRHRYKINGWIAKIGLFFGSINLKFTDYLVRIALKYLVQRKDSAIKKLFEYSNHQ